MTKFFVVLFVASPLVAPAAMAKRAVPYFTDSPSFKCDGGEGVKKTHMEFSALPDGVIEGTVERYEPGDDKKAKQDVDLSKWVAAKYIRSDDGNQFAIYRMVMVPAAKGKSRRELKHTEPQPGLVIKLVWAGKEKKNVWTGKLEDSGVMLTCTDHTKDDPKDKLPAQK